MYIDSVKNKENFSDVNTATDWSNVLRCLNVVCLSVCLLIKHHAKKASRRVEVQLQAILTSTQTAVVTFESRQL